MDLMHFCQFVNGRTRTILTAELKNRRSRQSALALAANVHGTSPGQGIVDRTIDWQSLSKLEQSFKGRVAGGVRT